jgi:SNF2 family DNA or RNA helicase
VYKLVSRGTVEEAICELQGEKRALVDGVLGETARAAELPLSELVALLSYGAR